MVPKAAFFKSEQVAKKLKNLHDVFTGTKLVPVPVMPLVRMVHTVIPASCFKPFFKICWSQEKVLLGDVAVVTGGGHGIGLEIAR